MHTLLSCIQVIDNWAGRFVDELDYALEVQNCELFRQQMVSERDILVYMYTIMYYTILYSPYTVYNKHCD